MVVLTLAERGFTTETVTHQKPMTPLFDKTIEGLVNYFRTNIILTKLTSTIQSRAIAGLANQNVNLFVYLDSTAHAKPQWNGILEGAS